VTGLTPEVLDALVRLMSGNVDYDTLDDEALYALGKACAAARATLFEVTTRLNDRGASFALIGERLGVHEATASRWAKPPAEDRRRRRRGGLP